MSTYENTVESFLTIIDDAVGQDAMMRNEQTPPSKIWLPCYNESLISEAILTVLTMVAAAAAIDAIKRHAKACAYSSKLHYRPPRAKVGLGCGSGSEVGREASYGGGEVDYKANPMSGRDVGRKAGPKQALNVLGSHQTCGQSMPSGAREVRDALHAFTACMRKTSLACETESLVAAVCEGRAGQLPHLLDAARARAACDCSGAALSFVAADHLLSAVRACVKHSFFTEAIDAYDHSNPHIGVVQGIMWSLLLYSAVEAQDFGRCPEFCDRLLSISSFCGNDFVNMVRYHAHAGDIVSFEKMMSDLRGIGVRIDAIRRNRALAVCTTHRAIAMAEVLAADSICELGMDTIGYNTLMKGHADADAPARCFQLYDDLIAIGLVPSNVTFGILLDACMSSTDVARAAQILDDMRRAGVELNVVHCTTYMKVLTRAGLLDDASNLLEKMQRSPATKPDLVAYSTLIKAYAYTGRVSDAMHWLEHMLQSCIVLDADLFNSVLTGCTLTRTEPQQVQYVLTWLVEHGLHATTKTLSITVQAFAQSRSWDAALDFLYGAHAWLHLVPENRLYSQLAFACSKANNSVGAFAAYAAMVKTSHRFGRPVSDSVNCRLRRVVKSCGSPSASAAAARLHQVVVRAGGLASPREVDAVVLA